MGYTITKSNVDGDKLTLFVEFLNGEKGSVDFNVDDTREAIIAKLDEIDANWPTAEDQQAELPQGLQDLIGFSK